jgi:DsbC/DsbD-like thiol-disulfide interchange protein/cytochrome c biogenesis protein CcdA
MNTRCYRLLVALLCHFLALLMGPTPAMAAPTNIAARLVAPQAVRAGERAHIVLAMQPGKGWHGYWSNPGDAGMGMTFDWTLPAGMTAGEPRYPVPDTLLIAGLMNHVYEARYALVIPLEVAANAPPGLRTLRLEARWLACTDTICVPERDTLEATVRVLAPGESASSGALATPGIDAALQKLPAPLSAPALFAHGGGRLRIAIPLPEQVPLVLPHVFPAENGIVDYAAKQRFVRKGNWVVVTLEAAEGGTGLTESRLEGVLRLDGEGNGIAFAARPGPVPAGGTPLAGSDTPDMPALGWLMLAALGGGLLLNVMPCVFPILSLKALSLARAGESERHARAEGLAYTAGVVLACLALGALLLLLRAGGEEVGWAFQLQEPGVVVSLTLLAAVLTANFAGLFEIALPGFAAEGGPGSFTRSAFATGLLAAFVATPCTGPFMAGAMGAALLLPPLYALALFAALGIGIALPFLAIAFIPALRRRLPRPGAWMTRFRRWMALPMGLTALALGWLVWRLGGATFLAPVAVLALAVLVLLWLAGRAQRRGRAARLPVLAACAVAVAGLIALPAPSQPAAPETSLLDVAPFSQAALDAALARKRPVFVWMTADWCLTCKVNERLAIERETTRDAFARAGVTVLRGDWTRRDPAITRYLTERGAAGVPLYVWYGADGKPEQLPQILTADLLAERALGDSAAAAE